MPGTRDPGPIDGEFRFNTTPYASDGGSPLLGLLLIAILSIGAGVIVGAFAGWISQAIYLVFIFPLGMSLAVGFSGGYGATLGKVRSEGLAFCVGALGGLAATLTMHFVEFLIFSSDMEKQAPGAIPMQSTLRAFLDFVDAQATIGVTFTGRGGANEMNLGYYGSYIYWFLELCWIVSVSGGVAAMAASAPFCTYCETWKESKQLGRINAPREQVLEAINSGDIIRLANADVGAGPGRLGLHAAICKNCRADAPIDIKFQEVVVDEDGNESVKQIAHVTYPGEALLALEEIFSGESLPEVRSLSEADEANVALWKHYKLTPAESKYAELWTLAVGPGELRLLDPQGRIQLLVPFPRAEERLVYPNFWKSVRNFGILADTGKVVWFENDKDLIKELQKRIKG